MEKLDYKMYVMVLYQLSDKQKGIQAQHAISRYGHKYKDDPAYLKWITANETTIILTPGGSDELHDVALQLFNNGIEYVEFVEPSLYKQVTALCFLVDERVWDRKKYPDPIIDFNYVLKNIFNFNKSDSLELLVGTKQNVFLRSFLPKFKLA